VKVVLDACVLYPHALRNILLNLAFAGAFEPLWSARILEEWARATRKLGPAAEIEARGTIARITQAFPRAMVRNASAIEARLLLPDPDDVHVLATAIAGHADAILTFNAMDFPRHVLAAEGIVRRDPDGFLWEIWSHLPDPVTDAVQQAKAGAEAATGLEKAQRAFLKGAGLPRLGKAMAAEMGQRGQSQLPD
jgi:predicted nucleic acid-binding protein